MYRTAWKARLFNYKKVQNPIKIQVVIIIVRMGENARQNEKDKKN